MYFRKLLSSNFSSIKPRAYSTVKHNEKTWDLMSYRYFVPVQTRYRDNNGNGHLYESVYHNMMLSVTQWFIKRYIQNPGDYKQFLVQNHCDKRSNLGYPQPIIAGLGIKKFDNEKIQFTCAFFGPNSDVIDQIPSNLQISQTGCLLENKEILELAENYEHTASTVGEQVLQFQPSDNSNVQNSLPPKLMEGMRLLELDKSLDVTIIKM